MNAVQASWGIPDEQNREPTNQTISHGRRTPPTGGGGGGSEIERGAVAAGGGSKQVTWIWIEARSTAGEPLCSAVVSRGGGRRKARWTLELGPPPPFDLQRPPACWRVLGLTAHLPRRLGWAKRSSLQIFHPPTLATRSPLSATDCGSCTRWAPRRQSPRRVGRPVEQN